MNKNKTFSVHLEGPTFELEIDEIWPDGDAPDNPTTEDVVIAMRDYGSRLIRDWALDDGLEVYVDGYMKV